MSPSAATCRNAAGSRAPGGDAPPRLVGQLAGGIAHDLNTLLTTILGYAELTGADPELPRVRGDLEQISGAAHRAGVLTTQLLAFTRRQMLAPADVDLDEVVAASRSARGRVAGKRIETVDEPADALMLVHVDAGQLERVLLDIVANAADAMPQGGKLTPGPHTTAATRGWRSQTPARAWTRRRGCAPSSRSSPPNPGTPGSGCPPCTESSTRAAATWIESCLRCGHDDRGVKLPTWSRSAAWGCV